MIGVSPSKAYLFCSLPECASETEPVYDNEERDSIIVTVSMEGRLSDGDIGKIFNITRARVQQIATARAIPYYERK